MMYIISSQIVIIIAKCAVHFTEFTISQIPQLHGAIVNNYCCTD